jgi:mono/diheme cytochrome c family protein
LRLFLIFIAAALLAGCALSAPPPERGSAPILTPQPATSSANVELPSRRPSVASGAAIYADKCVACHGAAGRGDGEQAAAIQSQFGAAPANLIADSIARASTPGEWFGVISAGRLENGMPPFSGSLSVDDRWDVIAYVWSLGASEDELAAGAAIYAERCVQCHGQTGKGDGPQAESGLFDRSEVSAYLDVAPGEWDAALETRHVPSFSGKLNGAERSAVIDYLRSFSYDTAAAVAEPPVVTTPGPDATAAPEPPNEDLTVNGSIVNGTGGARAPTNLEVTLYIFPSGDTVDVVTRTLESDATGRFSASGLTLNPGDVVAATTTYADVTYPSEFAEFDGASAPADLTITVYEPTTDTAAIHVDTLHIIITPGTDAVSVNETYVISNQGDRVVVNIDGPTLSFALPADAAAFQFVQGADPGAVAQSAAGFDLYDAVAPGGQSRQLVIEYQLPLVAAEMRLDRALTFPVASINLFAQLGQLSASSSELTDRGVLSQEPSYRQFSGGPLSAGQALTFRLSQPAAGIDAKLVGGAALLVVGVAAVGYGLWRSRARPAQERPALKKRAAATSTTERDRLIEDIAALDDAFDAGQIAEAEYRRRRAELKAKALRLMRDE